MPTTIENVEKIKSIIKEELPEITNERILTVFRRINEESGELSHNESYKISTRMLRLIYESPKKLTFYLKIVAIILFLLTCFHHVLFLGNLLFPFIAPFLVPTKYLILIIPSLIYSVNLPFTNVSCSLTKAENSLRLLLGRKEMKSFVHEYYIEPFKKLIGRT